MLPGGLPSLKGLQHAFKTEVFLMDVLPENI